MTPAHNPWSTERLDDTFRRLDADIENLETDIKALEPLSPAVAALASEAAGLRRDVGKVELAVQKYVNRSVTKQLIIVSTPLFFGCVALATALLTGKVG